MCRLASLFVHAARPIRGAVENSAPSAAMIDACSSGSSSSNPNTSLVSARHVALHASTRRRTLRGRPRDGTSTARSGEVIEDRPPVLRDNPVDVPAERVLPYFLPHRVPPVVGVGQRRGDI